MDSRHSPAQHQPHQAPPYPNAGSNNNSNSASPFSAHHPHPHQQPHGQGPPYAPPQPPPSAPPHHQRRPSDTPYYSSSSRPFPPESAHSRAQSASSLPSAREFSRAMPPPPNSPPQMGAQQQQQQHHAQQPSHGPMGYAPPPPRAPPVAVGPPSAFPSGRELPGLSSLTRSGSTGGSSMSISSMLGGPPSAQRDSQPPPSHYPSHSSAPGSGPGYAPSMQASPRMHSASGEYPPFRRPQTPDHQRPYEPRGSAAASPHGHYSTPEVQRYGTPQTYHSRHPSASADPSRDSGRMSTGPPPRPSSQPKAYPGMPPRPMEMGRGPGPDDAYGRREEPPRGPAPGPEYNAERTALRPNPFDDRFRAERERERERERRDEAEHWERGRRERAYSGSDSGRHPMQPHDMGYREPPRGQPSYGLPPPDARERRDPRDVQWGRPGSDPSFRAPIDQQRPHPDYPPASGPYPSHGPAYQTAPADRYPPSSHPPHGQGSSSAPPQPYESPDRARMNHLQPQHQTQQQPPHRSRTADEGPQPPSIAYNSGHGPSSFESARNRPGEDLTGPSAHQRNLLAIQDMSRKGRVSPLPQAVQGAQLQQPGPAAEPGIKSEFGRMFSGIGSGVSGIGVSSPITSAPAVPFNAGLSKRDDHDGAPESGPDASGKGAKGRRRKLKDEDSRGDDDSTGRLTPVNKAKRSKAHHHHQYVNDDDLSSVLQTNNQSSHHHHHHHHPEGTSPTSGIAALKSLKSGPPAASPTDKNAPPGHHHHHHHHHHGPRSQPSQPGQPKPPPPSPPVAKTKTLVSSQAVLDSVAGRPRHLLGDFIYEPGLKAGRLLPNNPTSRGFSSNPKPLPWDVIKGKENCILTVKVPRVNLAAVAREEITARAYLWGTDVYTDDSDVVAACVHSGWIKGEWSLDVDAATLDPDQNTDTKRRKNRIPAADAVDDSEGLINSPPTSGPMSVPADRDLHVNVLILPRLVKYSSMTRFGMTSREFGGEFGGRHVVHDGLSYMVKSIRWVENGAQPQARLRGQARRERMRRAMKEVKGSSAGNVSGLEREQERERLRGEISGNWWKKTDRPAEENGKGPDAEKPERGVSEGDKENRLADDDGDKDAGDKPEEDKEQRPADKDVEMAEAESGEKEAVEEK